MVVADEAQPAATGRGQLGPELNVPLAARVEQHVEPRQPRGGEFEGLIERMRTSLAQADPGIATIDALELAVLDFNRFPDDERSFHRDRMRRLLQAPSLVAHSTLRFAEWREVVAEFVAGRLGVPTASLRPQVVAWTRMAISIAAYEQWLLDQHADLQELLRTAYLELREMLTLNLSG